MSITIGKVSHTTSHTTNQYDYRDFASGTYITGITSIPHDDDSDGLYDGLYINTSIEVQTAANHTIKATVYTFTTPPDYNVPEGSPPEQAESLMINSSAEYSIDGGITKQPIDIKGQFNQSGARLIWELEPIPVNARELIFTITQIGDRKGRWEFKVPLVE